MRVSWIDYLKRGLSPKRPGGCQASGSRSAGSGGKLNILYPLLRRHRRACAQGLALVLLTSLLGLPLPLILRYIIDTIILGSRPGLLAGAMALLVVLALSGKLLGVVQRFYFARFEQNAVLDIQNELFKHSLNLPISFFDRYETGRLMSRLSYDIQGLRWFFSRTVVAIPTNLLQFLGGFGVLLYLEWRLALGILVIAPLFLLAILWFSARLHALSHRVMEQQASIHGRLQQWLSAISLIKAFSCETVTADQFRAKLKTASRITLEQEAVDSFANLVIDALPGLARTVVLGIGAYWVIGGNWTLGSLVAFQAYLGYVFGPAKFLASTNLQLQTVRAALERISSLFEVAPEENQGCGKAAHRLSGEVEFKNVCFSYDGKEPVLENMSFRVSPGEHVAVLGPSGAGKTTLLNLILRFYMPTTGDICFDGRPSSQYEIGSLRRRMGYVAQDVLLLSGTILENLRYGNPRASLDDVCRAARSADIHDFIEGLPKGYDSVIGEKGISLSEGQRQRLSIARALVQDPDILILDEPTAALDSLSEHSIVKSLPRTLSQKTIFLVTHRVTTARDSDRILLLNENRLVAVGTHDSLLESSDYYRSIVRCQQLQPDRGQVGGLSPAAGAPEPSAFSLRIH